MFFGFQRWRNSVGIGFLLIIGAHMVQMGGIPPVWTDV